MFNRLPGAMLISGHFCTNEARAFAAVMFAVHTLLPPHSHRLFNPAIAGCDPAV